jgi:hypothetical protein
MLTGIAIGVAATLAVLVVVSIFIKRHTDNTPPAFDMEDHALHQRLQMQMLISENQKQADILARISVAIDAIATEYLERHEREKK